LAEHGGEEWGSALIEAGLPLESFRDLKRLVSCAAREWIMQHA
jgi:hypothetical protein